MDSGDEIQLRDAISDASKAGASICTIFYNYWYVTRILERIAAFAFLQADVPMQEVEEAQKFLQMQKPQRPLRDTMLFVYLSAKSSLQVARARLMLRRRMDFLEKAIGNREEGELREAIAAARKGALPDDDEEVARANAILGNLLKSRQSWGCFEYDC